MAIQEVPKLNMSVGFAATSAIPIETNSYFKTYDEALQAASTAEAPGSSNTIYYFTQVIHVTEGIDAGIYMINTNKTLDKIGGDGDKEYVFTQSVAATEWSIIHNLNKYPSITVVDSGGNEVIGDIAYNSVNQVTILFSFPFSGKAYLN